MDEDLNVSESVTEIENNDVVTEQDSNDPESMLEAIQEGLKADEQEEKQEEVEEEKPEEEAAEDAKPENEDEPPEGISKKAQERFRSMVSKVKEKDEQISRLNADLEGIRSVMKDTGAKPEDFAMAFDYLKAVSSGNMEQVGRILQEQIKQYTLATGRNIDMADPLADYPDLRERVNSYQMGEDAALEMARMRNIQAQRQQQERQYYNQQESQQRIMQTRQQAMSEVDRMGAEWASRDPDYKAKEEIILKQIPMIAQNFPPNQWPQQVRMLYQTLSAMPAHKPSTPSPAPLRASGQTAGNRQPNSMLEALQNGLGYSNG